MSSVGNIPSNKDCDEIIEKFSPDFPVWIDNLMTSYKHGMLRAMETRSARTAAIFRTAVMSKSTLYFKNLLVIHLQGVGRESWEKVLDGLLMAIKKEALNNADELAKTIGRS